MQEALERRKRLRQLQHQSNQQNFVPAGPSVGNQVLPDPFAQESPPLNIGCTPGFQAQPAMFQPVGFGMQSMQQTQQGPSQGTNFRPQFQVAQPQPQPPGLGVGLAGVGMMTSRIQQVDLNQQHLYQQLQQLQQCQALISSIPQQQQQQQQQLLSQQDEFEQFEYEQLNDMWVQGWKGGKRQQKRNGGGQQPPYKRQKSGVDVDRFGNDLKTIEKFFFKESFLKDPWQHFKKR
eukprot:TRINITY_DN4644_c0_g1_i1.p2 TRINITY_DN4644_c0_g1~~TRINITY_DN4644_c0_g1_i1.p2  ORF type:complete len:233 (+),score=47.06 TRINITY_DN4644_c0_g1_i1:71-769(+)